jgi:DNA-directed RNA polymerase specialized sigma24 family protein
VLAIDAAITRLEALDARKAAVVEAKVFGGLTHQEIADSMGISLTTVESDWRMAKAWLAKELAP